MLVHAVLQFAALLDQLMCNRFVTASHQRPPVSHLHKAKAPRPPCVASWYTTAHGYCDQIDRDAGTTRGMQHKQAVNESAGMALHGGTGGMSYFGDQ
jgi:hypothetical protein